MPRLKAPSPGLRLCLLASLAGWLAGCGGSGGPAVAPPPAPQTPVENLARHARAIALDVDAATRTGTADINFAASDSPGASLEIGDLEILEVRQGDASLLWTDRGAQLDLGLRAAPQETSVQVRYRYQLHTNFDGATTGYTFTWPTYCGNLFPCQSLPARGADFSLKVSNPPAGQRVVQPAAPFAAAPAYQLGWAVGDYTDIDLGTTQAGTRLLASYLPGGREAMARGTTNLHAAFEWLEGTLGPYRFGREAGPVAVAWSGGAYGGMEHHPRWHLSTLAAGDTGLHVHEAAHGWFGNGVRLACWEDFVLSEGTASYLAGRALDVVAPDAGAIVWADYEAQLRTLNGTEPAWPATCNQIDVVRDGLYSRAPYIRGAFFLRALARKVGAAELDRALAAFYRRRAGQAARMQDLLDTVKQETGYDPNACAAQWLRARTIPTERTCA